jgi:hypothetical protein
LFARDAVEVGEFVEGGGVDGGVFLEKVADFGAEFVLDFRVGGEEPGGPGERAGSGFVAEREGMGQFLRFGEYC